MARRAADFGVKTGPVEVGFAAAMARMTDRVHTGRAGLSDWLAGTAGVSVIHAWGSLAGRDTRGRFVVSAGDRKITADEVYLNTGTSAFVPQVAGLADVPALDNASLLALSERPEHLIVAGGSYIGLEMGWIFRRLGSEVTIIHRGRLLAEREDKDVSEIIAQIMRDEGVVLHLDAGIAAVGKSMRGVLMTLEDGTEIAASHVMFATGRAPNTDRLGAESVGLTLDSRGCIPTDAHLKTNVAGGWALGDVNRRGAFTHTSYHDHEIVLAARDGLADLHQWRDADQRVTTYAMFTDPPLGRVGLTLPEARAFVGKGRRLLVADMPMSRVSRAKEEGETTGLIRLIVDSETERLVGVTVFGITGDEIIAVLSNFMATGASYRVLQQALPVHPTVAELLPTVLAGLKPVEADDA